MSGLLIPEAGTSKSILTQTRQVSHRGHGHSPIVQLSFTSMLAPEIKIVYRLLVAIRNRVAVNSFATADRAPFENHFAIADRDRVATAALINTVVSTVVDCDRGRRAADSDLRRLFTIKACDIENRGASHDFQRDRIVLTDRQTGLQTRRRS